jgi:hypothetical protein
MLKGMADAFKLLGGYLAFFDENDPNHERSTYAARLMKKAITCYRELYQEKQRGLVQSSQDKMFRKQDSIILTQSTSKPSVPIQEICSPSSHLSDLD